MKYFKINIVNGDMDIDYQHDLFSQVYMEENTAYGEFLQGKVRSTWKEITKVEFDNHMPQLVENLTLITNEEINKNQIVLMECLATQYEENQRITLDNFEVQATIYETLLSMNGGN